MKAIIYLVGLLAVTSIPVTVVGEPPQSWPLCSDVVSDPYERRHHTGNSDPAVNAFRAVGSINSFMLDEGNQNWDPWLLPGPECRLLIPDEEPECYIYHRDFRVDYEVSDWSGKCAGGVLTRGTATIIGDAVEGTGPVRKGFQAGRWIWTDIDGATSEGSYRKGVARGIWTVRGIFVDGERCMKCEPVEGETKKGWKRTVPSCVLRDC